MKGRGTSLNPGNRFERLELVRERGDAFEEDGPSPETVLLKDATRSIIATNDSPDVGFDASVNPYRGCENGCAYCYARPNHEYLGFSAGLDFETKILVKEDAPELLRRELMSPRWEPKTIAFSGVTDAYQPVERKLGITRRCLEVMAEFRNPVGIVTKSALVTRDIDILAELARFDAAMVMISLTSLDPELIAVMEPRAARPELRLEAVRELAAAGIPVGVNVQPIIPGLTDHEIPAILEAAAKAGARFAGKGIVRLPLGVAEIFEDWLEEHFPARKEKVLNRLREMRGGRLNDPNFTTRMRGKGAFAEQIYRLFEISKRRAGIPPGFPPLSTAHFRRPHAHGQLGLFGE
jgi:DNA repair photolyase